ncbi:molybdenum cofactor biosynthesis protein [Methanothermobacter thermautotrophicus]|jgi:molybdenum cofactor biosynthesis protein B|uniref:Molybdenum cofactor biosynthesis protein n=1 Tax=Methanothermobacter thermautotrophicus TaxID=145262 RepID=A0A842YPS7_METTF|nr:molybdenum cofactor biosynthesis protein B [Methanothermobacter thermautotrophicus]MBE2900630.1 molybdenum cofactor biosynthesis protein [Methanothermobacter thermautotrophicus]
MKSQSMEEHRTSAPVDITCGVITLSDSKYREFQETGEIPESDISGRLLVDALSRDYTVSEYTVIPDDGKMLMSAIHEMIDEGVSVIFTTGGTGIGSRDITVETLREIFEKELDGFGEIFRYLSFKELGAGAILSRATAGVYRGTLIFALPGSPNAVKLGIEIVASEIGHLVKHLRE